jgi:hypothetical protein
VVWSDDRNGANLDVYAYNFTTQKEELVVGGAGDQFLADIDGDRVVFTSNASGAEQVFLFTYAPPPPPPPPPPVLPLGCDPAKTDLVEGPVTLSKPDAQHVHAHGDFATTPGRTYYMCVVNGLPDGSLRTDDIFAHVDGRHVLSEKQFAPENDPKRVVAKKLRLHHWDDDDDDGDHDCDDSHQHHWRVNVRGDEPAQIAVSIRVAK